MIFADILFTVFSLAIIASLILIIRKTLSIDNEIKNEVAMPMVGGLVSVVVYIIFLFQKNHCAALFFDGLYFICTDFLTFFLLNFVMAYSRLNEKYKKFQKLFFVLIILDSISLIINAFTMHSFDLELIHGKRGFEFWIATFNWPHFIHLGLCYVICTTSFVILLVRTIKAPFGYKIKYVAIIVAYVIVLVANLLSYSFQLPIDISILFYTFFAEFLFYFSTYHFPHYLVANILRIVNETIADGIIYFNYKGDCLYYNKNASFIFQKDGKFSKEEAEKYYSSLKDEVSGLKISSYTKGCILPVDGKTRHFSVEYQKMFCDNSFVGAYLKFIDDTEETRQLDNERFNATHDELTGLYNRVGFFEAVDAYVRKHPDSENIMISSDIKDFKLVNELFGEKTGDAVLKMQANLIIRISHEDSIFGRIDGDKFALFCRKNHFSESLFLENINHMRKLTENGNLHMHIYIGLYEMHDASESAQIMYDKAALAIEQIRSDYQRVFARYDSELMDRLLIEKNIVNEFASALNDNQFKMYLQPQADSDGKALGAEALVRWHHPVQGVLKPGHFIGVLEKTGLINKLDAYIWEEAAKKLGEWKKLGFDDAHISVNVSPRDLYYIDIYETFTSLVEKYEIDPKNFNIEITETALLSDFEKTMELFGRLQEYGFKIEIDDFGSGYSSLMMLKDIKADVLKIDMMFLRETENKERSHAILGSVISMAKNLNMSVITEGVETESQFKMLSDFGCDFFQGYYFSKPIPVVDFEEKYLKA